MWIIAHAVFWSSLALLLLLFIAAGIFVAAFMFIAIL